MVFHCTAGTRVGDKLAAGLQACSTSHSEEEVGTRGEEEAETRGKGKGKKCPKVSEIENWFLKTHEGNKLRKYFQNLPLIKLNLFRAPLHIR